MGLKSGSRDAGLDESTDTDTDEPSSRSPDSDPPQDPTSPETVTRSTDPPSRDESRPARSSLPYVVRREKVNAGREQVPFFLRKPVIDGESELQNDLETILGEDVYKSDYREAAMVVAQRNPELIAEVLREWGYDLDR